MGGLIAVDNTLWYGKVADAAVQDKQTVALREFNARVLAGARMAQCRNAASCAGKCTRASMCACMQVCSC